MEGNYKEVWIRNKSGKDQDTDIKKRWRCYKKSKNRRKKKLKGWKSFVLEK